MLVLHQSHASRSLLIIHVLRGKSQVLLLKDKLLLSLIHVRLVLQNCLRVVLLERLLLSRVILLLLIWRCLHHVHLLRVLCSTPVSRLVHLGLIHIAAWADLLLLRLHYLACLAEHAVINFMAFVVVWLPMVFVLSRAFRLEFELVEQTKGNEVILSQLAIARVRLLAVTDQTDIVELALPRCQLRSFQFIVTFLLFHANLIVTHSFTWRSLHHLAQDLNSRVDLVQTTFRF